MLPFDFGRYEGVPVPQHGRPPRHCGIDARAEAALDTRGRLGGDPVENAPPVVLHRETGQRLGPNAGGGAERRAGAGAVLRLVAGTALRVAGC